MLSLVVFVSFCLPCRSVAAERPVLAIPEAGAKTEAEMKPYIDRIVNSDAVFAMAPIPGGTFVMGSPAEEKGRRRDEGPQFTVKVEPFWMGRHEVTWDEFDVFMFCLDMKKRQHEKIAPTPLEKRADAVTRPTKPYADMAFGMGKPRRPAISITQLAARTYCKWLSEKTGRYYRLPTEAEWEYACRAGTKTAYYFGDDPSKINDYAWHAGNSARKYREVGKEKKPNAWGLYDMHGNVAEWVLDQYKPGHYKKLDGRTVTVLEAMAVPKTEYPRVVRGGSWMQPTAALRSAARAGSTELWKEQDPQFPQSIWYHTDAMHVGFRVVRPLKEPGEEEKKKYWDAGILMPEALPNDKLGCDAEMKGLVQPKKKAKGKGKPKGK